MNRRLEYRRDVHPKDLSEYGPSEVIPAYVEVVPGPGRWYLDGEPITPAEAAALIADHQEGP